MKIFKDFWELLVMFGGVFAIGYWRGQSDNQWRIDDSAASAHSAGKRPAAVNRWKATTWSAGSVNVSPERQQLWAYEPHLPRSDRWSRKFGPSVLSPMTRRRLAQVFSKVEGWIEKLLVNYTGTLVQKGTAPVHSLQPGLGATQEEYLLALKAKQTLGSSSIKEISAGSDSLLESAHRRLSLWDISEEQINDLEKTGKPQRNSYFLFADQRFCPQKGRCSRGCESCRIRSFTRSPILSTVWVNADIYEYELANIRVGQKATISSVLLSGARFRRQGGVDLSGSRRKNSNERKFDWSFQPRLYLEAGDVCECRDRTLMPVGNWLCRMKRFWTRVSEKSCFSTKEKGDSSLPRSRSATI